MLKFFIFFCSLHAKPLKPQHVDQIEERILVEIQKRTANEKEGMEESFDCAIKTCAFVVFTLVCYLNCSTVGIEPCTRHELDIIIEATKVKLAIINETLNLLRTALSKPPSQGTSSQQLTG